MQKFLVHTIETAPEKSKPALEGLKNALGFIPNTAATMAGSPTLINSFVGGFGNFHGSGLNEIEKQTVLLTNAVTYRCVWTTAFHSTLALRAGVSVADVAAIREGRAPQDPRLAALSRLAKQLIEKKGHAAESAIDHFVAAGYSPQQVLDVIAGVALSTMAAFTANIADPPLEERFAPQAWKAA